jgi:hypothetical protein
MNVELPAFSMFARTPLYDTKAEIDGKLEPVVVFGLMVDPVSPDGSDEVFRVPPAGENRLDRIATQVYGIPDLWPVIASANRMIDPLVAVAVGERIQVPTKERLAAQGVLSV